MKIFSVHFDIFGEDGKITRESHLWTAPSLFAATAAASAEAYEFEKQLITVSEAGVIVRQIGFDEGQQLLERSINYGLLQGEGSE